VKRSAARLDIVDWRAISPSSVRVPVSLFHGRQVSAPWLVVHHDPAVIFPSITCSFPVPVSLDHYSRVSRSSLSELLWYPYLKVVFLLQLRADLLLMNLSVHAIRCASGQYGYMQIPIAVALMKYNLIVWDAERVTLR
jgi:hypothetical protein